MSEPKLRYAIGLVFLSIVFAYVWAYTTERAALVSGLVACAFFLASAMVIVSQFENWHYWSVTRYLEALIKLDPDLRNALSLRVPALRLVATRGRVVTLFADTNVSAEHFRLFLTDSDRYHTVAERTWNTAERPRWAWLEIYEWLINHDYVIPDSASGSRSYQWVGTAHANLCVYFLSRPVPNLNENTRVFAEEEEESKWRT